MKKKQLNTYALLFLLMLLTFLLTGCDPSFGSSDYGLQKGEYLDVFAIKDDIRVVSKDGRYYLEKNGASISEYYVFIYPLDMLMVEFSSVDIPYTVINSFFAMTDDSRYAFINSDGQTTMMDEKFVDVFDFSMSGFVFITSDDTKMFVTFDGNVLDVEYEDSNVYHNTDAPSKFSIIIGSRRNSNEELVYDLIGPAGTRIVTGADSIQRTTIQDRPFYVVQKGDEYEILSYEGESLSSIKYTSVTNYSNYILCERSFVNASQQIVPESTFINQNNDKIVIRHIENDGSINSIMHSTQDFVYVVNSKDDNHILYFFDGTTKTYELLTYYSNSSMPYFIFNDNFERQGTLNAKGVEVFSESYDGQSPLSVLLTSYDNMNKVYNFLIHSTKSNHYYLINNQGGSAITFENDYLFEQINSYGFVDIRRTSDNKRTAFYYSVDTIDLNTLEFYVSINVHSSMLYFVGYDTTDSDNVTAVLVDLITNSKHTIHEFESPVEYQNAYFSLSTLATLSSTSDNEKNVIISRIYLFNYQNLNKYYFAYRSNDNTLHLNEYEGTIVSLQSPSKAFILYTDNTSFVYALNSNHVLVKQFETHYRITNGLTTSDKYYYTITHAVGYNSLTGLMDESGNVVCNPIFHNIVDVKNNNFVVRSDYYNYNYYFGTKYGVITFDRSGNLKFIEPMEAQNIILYADGSYLVISTNQLGTLYSASGKKLMSSIIDISEISHIVYDDTTNRFVSKDTYFLRSSNGLGRIFVVDES